MLNRHPRGGAEEAAECKCLEFREEVEAGGRDLRGTGRGQVLRALG